MLKKIKNLLKSKRGNSLGELEDRMERLSSSLVELSGKMSSIEKETERIHEKINQLEEHQTLVNYGLMREIGMLGGNDNE